MSVLIESVFLNLGRWLGEALSQGLGVFSPLDPNEAYDRASID
jgi:hypothetical protein